MAEDAMDAPSSPLSSVPDNFQSPHPSEAKAAAEHPEEDVRASINNDSDDEQLSEAGGWDEATFNKEVPPSSAITAHPDSATPQTTNGQDFAQSDIDAAIAASLSEDKSTNSAKRARDVEDPDDEPSPPRKRSQKPLTGAAKAATARRRTMLYTSHKSPLIKINLTKLLRLPEAWRALSFAQQKELAAMLPDQPSIGGTGAHNSTNVLADALMDNAALRTDVREWHEGLAAGMEDPDWRDEAAEAMEKRARGEIGTGKWWVFDEEGQHDEDGVDGGGDGGAWWKDPHLSLM